MKTCQTIRIVLPLLLFASTALAQGPPPPLQPLPPPPQPPGNPVTTPKANLGKTLFWDEQMSSSRTAACGSCHRATTGGSDPRSSLLSAHSVNPGPDGIAGSPDDIAGSPGVVLRNADASLASSSTFGLAAQVTGRHAPSHINAAYAPQLFWDGRASGTFVDPVSGNVVLQNGGALESQAAGPPVSSGEMGHLGRDWTNVAARIAQSVPLALSSGIPTALSSWIAGRGYAELFNEAFGSPDVTAARILLAIASYERTQFSTQTPFDEVIGGNPAALSPDEQAGFQLFGQLPCARCHAGALMSNNQFHYIGVRPAAEDEGRMAVTHNPADLGAFRTPSLRNVALRPAYMHDGRFSTLAQVIDFYDRGGDFNAPNKDPRIVPLRLTPQQKTQLLAFLSRPLTDPRVAEGSAPFDRPTLYGEGGLVPHVLEGGVAGTGGAAPQPVALEPPLAGNPEFTVGVFGSLAGARAVLVIDQHEPPIGGIPTVADFARVETTLATDALGQGFGSATLAIPDDPENYGRTFYGRWYVEDPAADGGVAASPAFRYQVFGAHGAGLTALGAPGAIGATGVRLYAGWPNPFRTATTVRFDLARPSRATLAVYDVEGRVRRRLADRAAASAGVYQVTWDGRDDSGRDVAAGIYFYRLDTDGGHSSARVVRIQ